MREKVKRSVITLDLVLAWCRLTHSCCVTATCNRAAPGSVTADWAAGHRGLCQVVVMQMQTSQVVGDMASEEDDALLFLIYQHLKVHGFHKAAKVLEEHVTQVETPEERSNLQDIYTGWVKLCSLAQHAKQETEDSTSSKVKSIKQEPATREEECADVKPSSTIEEEDNKPSIDGVVSTPPEPPSVGEEAEPASEQQQQMDPAGGGVTADPDEDRAGSSDRAEEDGAEQELVPAEAAAEEPSRAGSCGLDPSDVVESGQMEDQQQSPEPDGRREDDEAVQESEETTDEASGPEQTEPTALCPEVAAVHTPFSESQLVLEDDPVELGTLDPTAQKTNDQAAESEAPPTAESESGCDEGQQEEEEEEQDSQGTDVASGLKPEEPRDDLQTENVTVSAAEEPEDVNIEHGKTAEDETRQLLPEEPAESCEEGKIPKKKKKKRKKERETAAEDTSTLDALSTTSRRQEDAPQAAPPKKAKKRKREREAEEDEEPPTSPAQNITKKKKKKVKDVEQPERSAEKKRKKKQKNRERKMQVDKGPVEGDEDTEKELDTTDVTPQSCTKKKHRLRKKLSLKKRLKLYMQEGRKRRRKIKINDLPAAQTETTHRKKQKKTQEATEETTIPKPAKKAKPEPTEDAPTKKTRSDPEENSSKENKPPKKKKLKEADESGVVSDLSHQSPDVSSSPLPNKREKRRKKTKSQDSPPKKKKNRIKEEPVPDASPPATKKKSSKRKMFAD
ncbi:DNA ligase 1-like isoform X2 [Betta splendens]|uniref:DNA ligase 1-like isoform X2 n=1 Tax=Betta splendens TaxID=158456 RepID=A0A8M1H6L1_BETSP|nr:DNA ligase 1-like isoform X2 [Betta splendens]